MTRFPLSGALEASVEGFYWAADGSLREAVVLLVFGEVVSVLDAETLAEVPVDPRDVLTSRPE